MKYDNELARCVENDSGVDVDHVHRLDAARQFRENRLGKAALIDAIHQQLATCEDAGEYSIADIAQHFCMSPRTLSRRLNAKGLKYRDLVIGHKKEKAENLLLNTKMPVSEISVILGYADASNFAKAFKAWSGLSPYRYRISMKNRDC